MRLFCCICKRHVEAHDETAFRRAGHDNTRTNQLRRGPVGTYRTLADMEREHAAREAARAAKEVEAHVE